MIKFKLKLYTLTRKCKKYKIRKYTIIQCCVESFSKIKNTLSKLVQEAMNYAFAFIKRYKNEKDFYIFTISMLTNA